MIHHGIHAALARERMNTFLAQAEADRLARRASRPVRGGEVRLRDGSAVLIRPVRPADDGLLADGEFGTPEYELALGCAPVRRD